MKRQKIKAIVGLISLIALAAFILLSIYILPGVYNQFISQSTELSYKSTGDEVGATELFIDVAPATKNSLQSLGATDTKIKVYNKKIQYFQPFLVSLNTHTGTLDPQDEIGKYDGEYMIKHVFIRTSDGREFSAMGSSITISQHHNTYVLFFPKADRNGKPVFQDVEYVEVFTKDLCKNPPCPTGHQTIRIDTPLKTSKDILSGEPATILFIFLAILLVIITTLSPCTIPVAAFIIALLPASVTDAKRESSHKKLKNVLDEEEWRYVRKNEIAFIAGHMVIWMSLGALLGFTTLIMKNTGVQTIFGGYRMHLQLVFGTILAFYALKFMGFYNYDPVENLFYTIKLKIMKYVPLPTTAQNIGDRRMTPISSFFTGMSISFACIDCVGPALLIPLVSVLGVLDWIIGIIFMSIYGAFIIIPILLVNYGFSGFLLNLRKKQKLAKKVSFVGGALLLFVAILILTGTNIYYDDWIFKILGGERFTSAVGDYTDLQRDLELEYIPGLLIPYGKGLIRRVKDE